MYVFVQRERGMIGELFSEWLMVNREPDDEGAAGGGTKLNSPDSYRDTEADKKI